MKYIEKTVANAIAEECFNSRWAPTANSCYVQDQGLRIATAHLCVFLRENARRRFSIEGVTTTNTPAE